MRAGWRVGQQSNLRRRPACFAQRAQTMTDERNIYDKFRLRLYRLLATKLNGAHRILDVGCGRCELCCYLARRFHCEVVGVDVSEEKLKEGTKRAKHKHVRRLVRCEKIDASRLTAFPDRSFDAAVSVYALHEIDKPVVALREVARVLKPNGKLVIVDFPKGSEASRLWHEAYYTPGQVRSMVSRAGLVATSSSLLAGGHLLMVTASREGTAKRRRTGRT